MTTISCMGGFQCPQRDKCKHHQTDNRAHPVERLCESGQTDAYEPIAFAAALREGFIARGQIKEAV